MNLRPLLLPLTPLYRAGLAIRERRLASGREIVRRLKWPVVSVGNLSTGGAGKTPLTIALAQALTRRGWCVDVLSRGYGRNSSAAAPVRPEGAFDEFGDEPLLIARQAKAPVYLAGQRYDAGLLAESAVDSETSQPLDKICPDKVHLLDDGFQHRQLHRDVDILLLNRKDWEDRLLPAGNLREPLSAARRAHVAAIPAEEPGLEADLRRWDWNRPIWRLRRRMEIPPTQGPVLAFCGIARPAQFFAGLSASGIHVAAQRSFPDHHPYSQADLDKLLRLSEASGASALMTTEKDFVRLAGLQSPRPILTVGISTEIEDEPAAIGWLVGRLGPG